METLQRIREKKQNLTVPFPVMWPTKLTNPSLQKAKKHKKRKKIKIPTRLVGFFFKFLILEIYINYVLHCGESF